MFKNDWKETASKAVMSIRHRYDIKKIHVKNSSTFSRIWKSNPHRKISTSNQCHNFHVDSLFIIDEILTNCLQGISTSNRWRIDKDVSIGSDNDEAFNSKGTMTKIKNYAWKDWIVLNLIIKRSIKIFEC